MPRSRPRKPQLDEVSLKVYKMLLERFGEPIHDQPAMVGARDEGPGGKALWNDEPKHDRNWSDPNVVREADDEDACRQHCGMMHGMGDENASCGMNEDGYMDEQDDLDEQGYDEAVTPPPASGVATHMNEKTPPGGERVVKALKKNKNVKNPWAVAWSMKNKGAKFKK